jgi:hypothetical protein
MGGHRDTAPELVHTVLRSALANTPRVAARRRQPQAQGLGVAQPGPHPAGMSRGFSLLTAPPPGGVEVWDDGQPANAVTRIMARMTQRRPRLSRENFGLLISAPIIPLCISSHSDK